MPMGLQARGSARSARPAGEGASRGPAERDRTPPARGESTHASLPVGEAGLKSRRRP